MNSKPLFNRDRRYILLIPPSASGFRSAQLLPHGFDVTTGELWTERTERSVYVAGFKDQYLLSVFAGFMWRYGLQGTLLVNRTGLWIVSPRSRHILSGVRLRLKEQWSLHFDLVDAKLRGISLGSSGGIEIE